VKTTGRSGAKILLVDDDAIVLNTLGAGLTRLGYAVQTFDKVPAALEHYQSNPPDLAILDYRMPQMNGLELARILIKETYRPIIMLSSFSEASIVRDAVGLGVYTYLVKPVEAECLAPSIEAALARFAEVNVLIKQGDNLQEGMEKNRIISTAVGIVMERAHLSQDVAFESLRQLARDQRRPLRDVAYDLVDAVSGANTIISRLRP
jgi:response regulator NasT